MLEAVAEALEREGHDVTVICAQGGYAATSEAAPPASMAGKSGIGSLRVMRMRGPGSGRRSHAGKLLSYFWYYTGVAWRLGWHRADVVVALTTPPYLSVLARFMTRLRGGRHAHWIMDVYPDVMVAHGMLRPNSWRHRILQRLNRWGFGGKRRLAVITLGPDMAERIQPSLTPAARVKWVPLWGTAPEPPDDAAIAALRQSRGWDENEVVFLYSGNMGLGHRFSEVLDAARQLAPQDPALRLAFYGNGRRRNEIAAAIESWPHGPVSLHDYVSREALAAHLASGDVHLASLDPAWDGTMLPSKLQGIFAAGRPVLFTGSPTGSIGSWILESGAGWVCSPGDTAAHMAAMREGLDPAVRARMGAAALAFSGRHFDKESNVSRIVSILTGRENGTVPHLRSPQ